MRFLDEFKEILRGGEAEDYYSMLIVLPFILILLIALAVILK